MLCVNREITSENNDGKCLHRVSLAHVLIAKRLPSCRFIPSSAIFSVFPDYIFAELPSSRLLVCTNCNVAALLWDAQEVRIQFDKSEMKKSVYNKMCGLHLNAEFYQLGYFKDPGVF